MTVRFFTSLMLREGEEIDASLVPWLQQAATVEFEEERPVTGVWQHVDGRRRVGWYANAPSPAIVEAHAERYGEEPFWVLRLSDDTNSVELFEHDEQGVLVGRRLCMFDAMGQLATERAYRPSGDLARSRTYKWAMNGLVLKLQESEAPSFQETTRWRIPDPGVPELSAEAFPSGGTLAGGTARVLGVVVRNQYQARCHAVHWRDGAWHPAIATIATMTRSALVPLRPSLDLGGHGVAPLLVEDRLARVRMEPGYTFYGIVEARPAGTPVQEVVADRPLDARSALRVAHEVGDIARHAHRAGFALGIRPELVFLRGGEAGVQLSAIAHRATAFLRSTYCGEAILVPRVLAEDFDNYDDVVGLAQLLWFMTTGDHPLRPGSDIAWNGSDGGQLRPARQPWKGPAAWEPLLDRSLFGDGTRRPSLEQFLSELSALVEPTHPYRS